MQTLRFDHKLSLCSVLCCCGPMKVLLWNGCIRFILSPWALIYIYTFWVNNHAVKLVIYRTADFNRHAFLASFRFLQYIATYIAFSAYACIIILTKEFVRQNIALSCFIYILVLTEVTVISIVINRHCNLKGVLHNQQS